MLLPVLTPLTYWDPIGMLLGCYWDAIGVGLIRHVLAYLDAL